jgi:hypothetical protein
LLTKLSFTNRFTTPYYTTGPIQYDPWVQDTPAYGSAPINPATGVSIGAAASIAPGLPVAYDPLWWNVTGSVYDNANPGTTFEGRFAAGMAFLRANPTDTGGPSANGLQRLNNLPGSLTGTLATAYAPSLIQQRTNYQVALETFVSPEDIVFQDPKGKYADPNYAAASGNLLTTPSPIVPDLTQNTGAAMALPTGAGVFPPQSDWRFTWMVTGQQRDTLNGSIFDINVVVHENRVFGVDVIGGVPQPSGETVVEAIWGFGASVVNPTGLGLPNNIGYAVAAKRTVLLLWPSTQPDPDVRVGQWIADVTYERTAALSSPLSPTTRYYPGSLSPPQRCFWYQIAKRTDPGPATVPFLTKVAVPYRQMTVWTTVDLNAQSMLYTGTQGSPVNTEAALIAPTVVNVIPRQVYTR